MRRLVLAFVLVVSAVWTMGRIEAQGPPSGSETRLYRVAGGQRDGTSAFSRVQYSQMKPLKDGEVDFQHFHSYEEATMLLKKWAAAFPNLVSKVVRRA